MNTNEFGEVKLIDGSNLIFRLSDIEDIQATKNGFGIPIYKLKLKQIYYPIEITTKSYKCLREITLGNGQ